MRGVAGSRQSGGRVFMGRDGAAGEFVGAALRWWRGEEVGEPGEPETAEHNLFACVFSGPSVSNLNPITEFMPAAAAATQLDTTSILLYYRGLLPTGTLRGFCR